MIKLITLLHKRADLSREQFIARYENGHKHIGEKYLRPHASRYLRRYCRTIDSAVLGGDELPADVVMEIWFNNQAAFDAAMAALSTEAAQAEIIADEEQLFDRSRMVSFVVDEYESDFT